MYRTRGEWAGLIFGALFFAVFIVAVLIAALVEYPGFFLWSALAAGAFVVGFKSERTEHLAVMSVGVLIIGAVGSVILFPGNWLSEALLFAVGSSAEGMANVTSILWTYVFWVKLYYLIIGLFSIGVLFRR